MASEVLTPAQRAAVENRGGPLLVSAAAGSGKTKVLVDRLLEYLTQEENPANIDDFLMITYTKAAASELRGKIAAKLTERLSREPENRHLQQQIQRLYLAKISTVHSFCADLLREYAFALELPGDMRVADEPECADLRSIAMEAVLEEAYGTIGENPALQAFVDTQGFGRDDRAVPELVGAIYDSARCHVRPQAWLERCVTQGDTRGLRDAGETVWGAYLIDRLHCYIDGQTESMEEALRLAREQEDLGPKYGPTLEENLRQLRALRACGTWDEIHENRIQDFGRLKAIRNPIDPEAAQRIKAIRKGAYEGIKARQAPFATASGKLLEDLEAGSLAVQGLVHLVTAFGERYRREKERRRVLDFGDLEHRTLELLLGKNCTGPTRAAREVGSRFREVMVDEYQDTNEVQDRIFSALTGERGNLFLVGDVKQSIYRFRLADPGIFLEKYRTFLPAERAKPGQGRKILLSENFRSGPEVLEAANEVFRCTMCPQVGGLYYSAEEALRPGIPRSPLPQSAVELHCIELEDTVKKYEAEARFVARRIRELLEAPAMVRAGEGLRPVEPGDVVILLRSPGTSAQYYLDALRAQGIPAATDAGGSILTTGEISVLRSLLQVLDNPLQDIPLEAVLASPVFGFTADHLGAMRAGHKEGPLFEALAAAARGGDSQAADFLTLTEALRQTARLETLTRLLEEIYARTHLVSVFAAMEGGPNRKRNLEFFFETAAAFEQGGRRDLPQFLEHLNRLEERGLRPEDGAGAANAVSILSIHKSKGLEYPVVFLSNLSGRFNREDLRPNLLVDPELGIGCSALDQENRCRYPTLAKLAIARRTQEENVSEELRVLYVAMTRAKDMLIMTYASKYLRKRLEELASRLSPRENFALSQEADCPGHWVLMAAMLRTEAGELFQVGGRPAETRVSEYPWRICCHTWAPGEEAASQAAELPEPVELPPEEPLQALLSFRYPHGAAVKAPSKVTATQLKGRELDEEAAEGSLQPRPGNGGRWKVPDFIAPGSPEGREIGTATHLAMQFIRYEACTGESAVEAELKRLREADFLTERQAQAVNRQWILRFFGTELGKRLASGREQVLREFKFSLLEDGSLLEPELRGEKLLFQGVVDCCLMEADGLTVLDFKTDRVRPGEEPDAARRYAPQVLAYGRALERIFEKPVKALLLYFFRTGALIPVSDDSGMAKTL